MGATPKPPSTSAQSPAKSLVGRRVLIPREIFDEDDVQYTGIVTGTPGHRRNAVYVKVDQDATEYWFPAMDVANWLVGDKPATTNTPRQSRLKGRHLTNTEQSVATVSQRAETDEAHAHSEVRAQSHSYIGTSTTELDAGSCLVKPQEAFTDTLEDLVSA